jgi:PilZ domain
MDGNQRDAERVPMLGEFKGEIMVFEPMLIKEVSRGGAVIETDFPLHLNSLHDIRITLGNTSVIVKARVVHSRISDVDQNVVAYRTGVEFVEAPERVLAAISDFLELVRADRAGA